MEDLWGIFYQEFKSASTSINKTKMPSSIKFIKWKSGSRNADIGGGKYDNVTEYLSTIGVENIIFDPYNRGWKFNEDSVSKIKDGQCDTATVNNVLNVIKEKYGRKIVIERAYNSLKKNGTAYFLIYEKNGDGVGENNGKNYQANRKVESYIDEVKEIFPDVTLKKSKKLIIAKKS